MNCGRIQKQAGFTLIELMITVAVVGILAAIAYPSYKEAVAKGKRAQARTVLSQAQQWMERNYSENYSYTKNAAGTTVDYTSATGDFQKQFGIAPVASEGATAYTLAVDTSASTNGTTYTITATRTGSMANDRCGDYTVSNTGRKAVINHSSFGSGAVADLDASRKCWS